MGKFRRIGLSLWIGALTLGICLFWQSTLPAAEINYAHNPGFEEVKDGKPVGWGYYSWAPNKAKPDAEEMWVSKGGRNDSAALKIVVRKEGHVGDWCNTPRPFTVPVGKDYVLSVWVRLEGESVNPVCVLSAGFTDVDWKVVKSSQPSEKKFQLVPTEDWQLLSLQVHVPEGTARVRIDFSLKHIGTVYFDDVSFVMREEGDKITGKPSLRRPPAKKSPVLDGEIDDNISMAGKSIFVIGDSISCYYGRHLKKILEGFFDYDRLSDGTKDINGGDSSMVLKSLRAVKNKGGFKPDYLLLNCGLHDIKKDLVSGKYQVPPDDYEKNLRKIYSILHEMGIKFIWIRTTPVKDRPEDSVPRELKTVRHNQDVISYNHIADEVMKEYGIPIIDLYRFTKNLGDFIYLDNVHFYEGTAAKQAAFIAGYLNAINAAQK